MVVAGYRPSLGFMGGGGGLSLSFVNFSTSTSSTIAVPSGAIAGDWAILFDVGWTPAAADSVSAVTPSGWTNLANGTISGADVIRLMTSHVVLTAGMIGSSVIGMNTDRECKIMIVVRPSTSIVTTTPSSWNSEVTAGNPSAQTVTASGITTPLVVVAAGASSTGSTAFSTETPAMTNIAVSSGGDVSLRVGYIIYNSAPANQSIDINDLQENGLQSGYVRFT